MVIYKHKIELVTNRAFRNTKLVTAFYSIWVKMQTLTRKTHALKGFSEVKMHAKLLLLLLAMANNAEASTPNKAHSYLATPKVNLEVITALPKKILGSVNQKNYKM